MRGILGLLGDFLLHRKAGPPNDPSAPPTGVNAPLVVTVGDSLTQLGNIASSTRIENQGDSIIGWANALIGSRCKHIVWYDAGATAGSAFFRGCNFGILGDIPTNIYARRAPIAATGAKVCVYLAGTNGAPPDDDPLVSYASIEDFIDYWLALGSDYHLVVCTIPGRTVVPASPTGTDIDITRWAEIAQISQDIRDKVAADVTGRLHLCDLEAVTVKPTGYVLLANFDGADAATVAVNVANSAQEAFTFFGNAQLDTAQKKFGTASLLLDGTGDYVTLSDSPDYDFDGPFQIDVFFRYTGSAWNGRLVGKEQSGNHVSWYIEAQATVPRILMRLTTNGVVPTDLLFPTAAITADTWHHVRITRDSNNDVRCWFNGTKSGTTQNFPGTTFQGTGRLCVGARHSDGAGSWNGWIDSVWIKKGSADSVTDADITVPTAPPDPWGNPHSGVTRDGVHLAPYGAFVCGTELANVLDNFVNAGSWWDTDAGSLNLLGNPELTGSQAVASNSCTGTIPGSPCTILNTAGAAQPVTSVNSVAANAEGGQTWTIDISSADGAGAVGTIQELRAGFGTINVAAAGLAPSDWVQMFAEIEVHNPIIASGKGLIGDVQLSLLNGTITSKGFGFTNNNRDAEPWPILDPIKTLHAYTEPLPVNAATVITPRINIDVRRDVGSGSCQVKVKRAIVRKVNNPSIDVPYVP